MRYKEDMSRLSIMHKACGGLFIEDDEIHADHPAAFLTGESFSITCLTCLEEVTDPSDLTVSEILSQ